MLAEIERFVNWMRRRNPEAHTWRDYRCDLEQFAAVVGNRPPGEITYKDVDSFVAAQVDAGHKASTINRRLAAVLSFFTFLSDEEPVGWKSADFKATNICPGPCASSRTSRPVKKATPAPCQARHWLIETSQLTNSYDQAIWL